MSIIFTSVEVSLGCLERELIPLGLGLLFSSRPGRSLRNGTFVRYNIRLESLVNRHYSIQKIGICHRSIPPVVCLKPMLLIVLVSQ